MMDREKLVKLRQILLTAMELVKDPEVLEFMEDYSRMPSGEFDIKYPAYAALFGESAPTWALCELFAELA